MSHLSNGLPDRIELGAQRREEWSVEINDTDGGNERRDGRWDAPLRGYDVSLPVTLRDDVDYLAVKALFAEAKGSLHSFDFIDWTDDDIVPVRFDGPLQLSGYATHLDQLSFSLIEVKDPEAA